MLLRYTSELPAELLVYVECLYDNMWYLWNSVKQSSQDYHRTVWRNVYVHVSKNTNMPEAELFKWRKPRGQNTLMLLRYTSELPAELLVYVECLYDSMWYLWNSVKQSSQDYHRTVWRNVYVHISKNTSMPEAELFKWRKPRG